MIITIYLIHFIVLYICRICTYHLKSCINILKLINGAVNNKIWIDRIIQMLVTNTLNRILEERNTHLILAESLQCNNSSLVDLKYIVLQTSFKMYCDCLIHSWNWRFNFNFLIMHKLSIYNYNWDICVSNVERYAMQWLFWMKSNIQR